MVTEIMKKHRSTLHWSFRSIFIRILPLILVSGFCFLFSSCREQPIDSAKTAGTHPETFSVAFYNVENLFDYEFDGKEYPEYRPDPQNWNQQMFDKKYDNIASVIAALNAGIIALCEVEDRDALNHLADVLKKKGCTYQHRAIIDTFSGSNTHPAILSRYPVKKSVLHPIYLAGNLPTRGILEADIDIKGVPLKIFVNHWPSKKHPESFRLAAADTLASLLSKLPKQCDYLLLGDFNSDYNEFSTFTTFGHNDTRGITGINTRLGTTQPASDATTRNRFEDEVLQSPNPSHYNLWLELPDAIRMSYVYKGNRQTPDNILIPPALFDTNGVAYIDNSFNSFTWGSRLLKNNRPIGWQMRYAQKRKFHIGEGYSDHLPIVAKFTTAPFSPEANPVDFNTAFTTDNNNPDSWFEFHTNGWISLENSVTYVRDTITPVASGRYSLHVVAPEDNNNYTVMRAVVPSLYRDKKGDLHFYIRGSGAICFRTKNTAGEWRYHTVAKYGSSGRASYTPFQSTLWQTVTLQVTLPAGEDVELELRSGKNVPLDLWIDR